VQRGIGQFLMFVLVLSVVVGAVHYYLWARLVRSPGWPAGWYRAGTWAAVGLALMTPLGLFVSRSLPRLPARIVSVAVFGWMGIAFVLLSALLVSELVRAGFHGVALAQGRVVDAERRTFLARAIAGGVGLIAVGFAGVGAAGVLGAVGVQPVRVALARWPGALAGYRIVQLTDLHIGPTLGRDWLHDVVARTNALEPDLVVITGDLVDGSVDTLREHTAPLADLRARHGVFFVTGNHDYYSGADAWVAELTRLGVRVLRNERVPIGDAGAEFDLAGVEDWAARNRGGGRAADLARALEGREPERAVVLLAHQPKQIVEAAAMGVGLQLSGHTHGGQIFPWNFLVRLDQPYIAGLSRHGDTQIYVSRGTGYWGPPMRVGAPSEITLLEVHPA
jgi:uncharacterized protein